ncbi:hypothetical protein [Burkholderia sp. YIM B11467]
MKRIFFFATKNDILAITDAVEKQLSLRYILAYHNLFPEYDGLAPRCDAASQIPTLGVATRKQTSGCERYVVTNNFTHVEPVVRVVSGKEYAIYEPGNCPDCIEFTAGGFWGEHVLINGLIQTWSDSVLSQQLMRKFSSAIRKSFSKKIGAYWIGPEAFLFLRDGGRLTLNVEAASSFDIKLPQ